jgi:hypothetical protein
MLTLIMVGEEKPIDYPSHPKHIDSEFLTGLLIQIRIARKTSRYTSLPSPSLGHR